MYSRTFLRLREYTIISVDPGLTCTGIAAFKHKFNKETLKTDIKLASIGSYSSDKELDLLTRVRCVSDAVNGFIKQFGCDVFVCEVPPLTLYTGKFASRDLMKARAQSIFQLFALVYGMQVALIERKAIDINKVAIFQPSQWQPSKKKRGGLDSKEWSLGEANRVIASIHESPLSLHTAKEENIADAINIGYYFLKSLEKSWA